MAFSEDFKSCS